jgi:hypothetical protein
VTQPGFWVKPPQDGAHLKEQAPLGRRMDRKPRSNSASHFVLILPVFSSQAAFRSRSAKDRNKGFRSMTQSPHQHRAASVKRTSLVRLAVRTLICLAAGRPDGSSRRPEDIIVIASASATTEHALSVRPDALDASHREPAPRNPRIGSHSQTKASGKSSGAGDICTPRRIVTHGVLPRVR